MERRVGIWRAGFDEDGVLFCNQQFGDWPMAVEQAKEDPWAKPEWYLLSYQKAMSASSCEEGREPSFAADENIQTWWRAAGNQPGEWISMDLGEVKDVRAVQINFADDKIDVPLPGERQGERYIDPSQHKTRWLLEASADGTNYFVLADKSDAETNLPHDFVVKEEGVQIRYLKLTVLKYRTIRIHASPAFVSSDSATAKNHPHRSIRQSEPEPWICASPLSRRQTPSDTTSSGVLLRTSCITAA